MPSFSGKRVTVTVSSTPRLMVRPPPNDLPRLPPALLPCPSPLDPKLPPLSPDCPVPGYPLLGGASDPQPSPPTFSSVAIGVDAGSSDRVVKALVVLEGSLSPFLNGFAAVMFDEGVASLFTICVWPLCRAGLAHGSSSRFSNESFVRRRDLEEKLVGVI